MSRPICNACNRRFVAINYTKNNKAHYRTRCDSCTRKNRKMKTQVPRWQIEGYQKKKICDRCGFVAKSGAQILVYHVDGNLKHCNLANLRSICLNCSVEIVRLDLPWKVGDLVQD